MAAPALTAPGTPLGTPVIDPHATMIVFASDRLTMPIWEKALTPFSFMGGEPINTGNMRNTAVVTKAPQTLVEIGNATIRVAYDPAELERIYNKINSPDEISFVWSTRDAMAVWGYAQSFVPDEMVKSQEAQQPTGLLTIVATCYDPATGTEEPPVWGVV